MATCRNLLSRDFSPIDYAFFFSSGECTKILGNTVCRFIEFKGVSDNAVTLFPIFEACYSRATACTLKVPKRWALCFEVASMPRQSLQMRLRRVSHSSNDSRSALSGMSKNTKFILQLRFSMSSSLASCFVRFTSVFEMRFSGRSFVRINFRFRCETPFASFQFHLTS